MFSCQSSSLYIPASALKAEFQLLYIPCCCYTFVQQQGIYSLLLLCLPVPLFSIFPAASSLLIPLFIFLEADASFFSAVFFIFLLLLCLSVPLFIFLLLLVLCFYPSLYIPCFCSSSFSPLLFIFLELPCPLVSLFRVYSLLLLWGSQVFEFPAAASPLVRFSLYSLLLSVLLFSPSLYIPCCCPLLLFPSSIYIQVAAIAAVPPLSLYSLLLL